MLLSPLDWGFGHTTRCIPLVQSLLSLNCSVIIACNQWQKALLEPQLPGCRYEILEGYNILYGRTATSTRFNLLLQLPRLYRYFRREQKWLNRLLLHSKIDGIISDNRYGLFNTRIPSVIITHQLAIQTGLGDATDRLVQLMHYRLLHKFSACWVPDNKEMPYAAGHLSHQLTYPDIPTRFLGCLSRMNACSPTSEKGPIVILLSGPEPQRTILENNLFLQLGNIPESIVFIRGTSTVPPPEKAHPHVEVRNFVQADELNGLLCRASVVIARSGYTTVMDILKLKKKSILIPTPGQTEQEYLGSHLMQNKWAFTAKQNTFQIQHALESAKNFPYELVEWDMEQYREVLSDWVDSLAVSAE